jgi:hypothetical protein
MYWRNLVGEILPRFCVQNAGACGSMKRIAKASAFPNRLRLDLFFAEDEH